jgi:hypothetical protein
MSESVYDEKIVPLLAEVGKLCQEYGLPFVGVVEYEPGKRGETRFLTPEAGLAMVMLSHMAKTGENIDGFMIGLARYCAKNKIDTSASLYLSRFKGS